MSLQNLAIIWAPNLLKSKDGTHDDAKLMQELAAFIFEHCLDRFLAPYEKHIRESIDQTWLEAEPDFQICPDKESRSSGYDPGVFSGSSRTPTTFSNSSPQSMSPVSSNASLNEEESRNPQSFETGEHTHSYHEWSC
ncbi:hypothetical protein Ciccas_004137 [Cichlidogyrus casuarinus]|uniref:Rho-GAP domain-containing protein n=1 Tax=Cichlidogyrus casuarinus TaxID=1844966 RepID=A0ABD2QEN5_9PLAT